MTDPRTPVVVGVAQLTRRPEEYPDVALAAEPVDLMAEVARQADADAGASTSLLARLDAVWVPQPLSRRYPDPGRLVLRRLEREEARSFRALLGGNSPQLLLNEAAAAIQRADLDVCLITGAEAMYSRFRAKREGVELPWERSDAPPCPDEVGDTRPGTTADESAHGASIPIEIYPLIETAARAAEGHAVEEHQAATGALWARFAAVAAANPFAWARERYSPEQIVTPGADNRVVTFPYTKRMCANMSVDQAAAVLVTSYETARHAGVPDDRIVFPLGGADAHDHFFLSERWSLAESPAIREVGRDVLASAGIGIDEVTSFDLYSCFPSAVQVAMDALGITPGDKRPITLTGGLSFFGGPGNDYVTHSIVETVEACRADPGSVGLVTGVGWYLTKHSVGLYSSRPPDGGFQRVDPVATQTRVDALPRRTSAGEHDGPATVEATAVVFSRDGDAERAVITALTEDGARAFAFCDDPDVLVSMVDEAWEGRAVKLRPVDGRNRLQA